MKAGTDWASAGVADASALEDPLSRRVAFIDGAALPKVLGGTGPDAVPVQVAARSVGILKDLPVPAVDEPWGSAAAAAAAAAEAEKRGGGGGRGWFGKS